MAYDKPRKCRFCGKETKLNPKTGRYSVICDRPECKELARKEFLIRMNKKYGVDTLLNDGEHQVKMAQGKSIKYVWSDGSIKYCLSQNEVAICVFLDKAGFPPEDVVVGEYIIKYMFEGKPHQHILDFYIPSIDLGISAKDSIDNPNTRPNVIKDRHKNWAQYEHIRKHETMSFIQIEGVKNTHRILDVILEIKRHNYKKRIIIEPEIDKHFIQESVQISNSLQAVSILDIKRNNLYAGTVATKALSETMTYHLTKTGQLERPLVEGDFIEGYYYLLNKPLCLSHFTNILELRTFCEEYSIAKIQIPLIEFSEFDVEKFANEAVMPIVYNDINLGVDLDG
jgi:hypothetical protein